MSDDQPLDVVVDADVLGRHRTGDETYTRELLRSLSRLHGELRVGAVSRRSDQVPENLVPVELDPVNQLTRLAWELPHELRRLRARLAHFQYIVPPLYRGRSVVTVHDLAYELLPELEDRVDRWILRRLVPRSIRRSELVFTVSQWTKQDLVDRYGIDPDKVVVTFNGVGDDFHPEGPRPQLPPYLLFVGALRPRKDPITALRAFTLLDDLGLELVMVGPDKGLLRAVESFVETHGLSARVAVLGHVSNEVLAALYRGAQCLLFPSLYEGFGLPVLEAMASGAPVVATSVGAIPEIAGDAALLVPPRDPRALADGVRSAITKRDLMSNAGVDRAARFKWEDVATCTMDGYLSVLGTL